MKNEHNLTIEKEDLGCEYAPSCLECPYVDGLIFFTSRCIEDYPNKSIGMVAEIRGSMLDSASEQGFALSILARIFNITEHNVRNQINKYRKRKRK